MMKSTIAVEEEQIATTAGKLFTAGEEPRPTAEEVRNYHERARDVHLLRRDTKALYSHLSRIDKSLSDLRNRVAAMEQHAQKVDDVIRKLRDRTGLIDWDEFLAPSMPARPRGGPEIPERPVSCWYRPQSGVRHSS